MKIFRFILIFFSIITSFLYGQNTNYLDLDPGKFPKDQFPGFDFESFESELERLATKLITINSNITKLEGKELSTELNEQLKKTHREKLILLYKIRIRYFLYQQLGMIRIYLIEKKLAEDKTLKNSAFNALTQTNEIINDPAFKDILELVNKALSTEIIKLLFDVDNFKNKLKKIEQEPSIEDIKNEIKIDAINLNKYVIYIQNWADILINQRTSPIMILNEYENIVKDLAKLSAEISKFYIKNLKGIALDLSLKYTDNLLRLLRKTFYFDIANKIREADDENTKKILRGYFKLFNEKGKIGDLETRTLMQETHTSDVLYPKPPEVVRKIVKKLGIKDITLFSFELLSLNKQFLKK